MRILCGIDVIEGADLRSGRTRRTEQRTEAAARHFAPVRGGLHRARLPDRPRGSGGRVLLALPRTHTL
eukprot:6213053-Pleurochrysis_carterae.AAC.1